jgi:hypothetical protein
MRTQERRLAATAFVFICQQATSQFRTRSSVRRLVKARPCGQFGHFGPPLPTIFGKMLKNGFQDFAYMLVTIDLKMVLRLTAEQNPVQNCKEEQAAPLTHEGLPIDIISPNILCINEEWIIALGI